jgi:hypothetical protein
MYGIIVLLAYLTCLWCRRSSGVIFAFLAPSVFLSADFLTLTLVLAADSSLALGVPFALGVEVLSLILGFLTESGRCGV